MTWKIMETKKREEGTPCQTLSFNIPCYLLKILYFSVPPATKLCQSWTQLTLWDPIDGSPPSSSVPGILQARTLEWVAISFSNAGKWKVKVKSLSCVRLFKTPWTEAYQAPLSMGFSSQEYWHGLPLPSPSVPPMTLLYSWVSCSVISDSLQPHGL